MKILFNNNDLNEAINSVPNLGFVPTMGSLHNGHISLIKESIKKSSKTIVSIFVNPTQFNNKKDFNKYPRNYKKDLSILKTLKVDYVYIPSVADVYKVKNLKKIKINKKDKILCAKYRKGHFEGVIEVMKLLTKSIKPKKIYMGEKDYQQFCFVKKHIEKRFICKIILCKTIRDKEGLALSSRNLLLNKNDLIKARKLSQNLIKMKHGLKKSTNIKKFLTTKKKELKDLFNIKIEYLELRNKFNLKITSKVYNSKIFIAYYLNKIRLIDNF